MNKSSVNLVKALAIAFVLAVGVSAQFTGYRCPDYGYTNLVLAEGGFDTEDYRYATAFNITMEKPLDLCDHRSQLNSFIVGNDLIEEFSGCNFGGSIDGAF